MSLASGSRVRTQYIVESTQGVVPAGTPKTLRVTANSINLTKNLLESAEIRSSGQISDQRHGFNSVAGQLDFQLSHADFNDLFEWCLRNTWHADYSVVSSGAHTTLAISGAAGSAAAGYTCTLTRASGNFVTEEVRPGYFINLTDFASSSGANNGRARVTAVTTTTLTLHRMSAAFVNESALAAADYEIMGTTIDLGNTLKTWSIEREHQDTTQFQAFNAVAPQSLTIRVSPTAMATGSVQVIGMKGGDFLGVTSLNSSPSAASTNSPFAAFDGTILENGALIAVVTSLELTINLNASVEPVVGSKFSPAVFGGTASVVGTLTAFLESGATLPGKFKNETETTLYFSLESADGTQWLNFILHRVKINGSDINPPQTGAVPVPTPFAALEHGTYATCITIQRSA